MPIVNVVLMDNPFGVKGSTNKNEDGSYTIIINSRLSYEDQCSTYKHEINHILNGDFDMDDVQKIEYFAHN